MFQITSEEHAALRSQFVISKPGRGGRRYAPYAFTEQGVAMGELLYGAERRGGDRLRKTVRELVAGALTVLPFDEAAAGVYGPLRAQLESSGEPLAEPDLRIASIALARDLTLVTANLRHFDRVPDLHVENWLS